jgi:hypothetical protein
MKRLVCSMTMATAAALGLGPAAQAITLEFAPTAESVVLGATGCGCECVWADRGTGSWSL